MANQCKKVMTMAEISNDLRRTLRDRYGNTFFTETRTRKHSATLLLTWEGNTPKPATVRKLESVAKYGANDIAVVQGENSAILFTWHLD